MVATIDGENVESNVNACGNVRIITPYHVELYINRGDAKQYGLRNFRIDPPKTWACGTTLLPI